MASWMIRAALPHAPENLKQWHDGKWRASVFNLVEYFRFNAPVL
jgi:hypothetical protein